MNLLCKYYSNQARLENSVQYLSSQPSFRFFCVSGMIVKNKRSFDVLTDNVTLVVVCVLPNSGKSSMMLLTSDPALREKDGEMVDTASLEYDPVFYNLCLLLQAKFKMSQNPVTAEFRNDSCVVSISISEENEAELQCSVRSPSGVLVVHGTQNIRDMLKQCNMFHSFRYVTETEECHREVTVKRSRGGRVDVTQQRGRTEILREIARYLNRTLVLVSFLPDGDLLEQYIGSNGLVEVVSKEDGTRIYRRVPGQRLRETDAFCVYQSVSKIDDILKEQGRALRTQ